MGVRVWDLGSAWGTISGFTKPVALQAVCTTEDKQKVTCEGTYSLNMTDYEVEPPTAMLGLLKAGEKVTVNYRAVFVP